jgi:hypothetical protein
MVVIKRTAELKTLGTQKQRYLALYKSDTIDNDMLVERINEQTAIQQGQKLRGIELEFDETLRQCLIVAAPLPIRWTGLFLIHVALFHAWDVTRMFHSKNDTLCTFPAFS